MCPRGHGIGGLTWAFVAGSAVIRCVVATVAGVRLVALQNVVTLVRGTKVAPVEAEGHNSSSISLSGRANGRFRANWKTVC